MDELKKYLEERSEGVLRLLEGGKRRGLEELRKGKGRGSQKALFQTVATSQRTFLELHDRCRNALRASRLEEAREIVLDVQYLLHLFSREVFELAFASPSDKIKISFPPPEAYSRHYPGPGPEAGIAREQFARFFGETAYTNEKSTIGADLNLDREREERLCSILQYAICC